MKKFTIVFVALALLSACKPNEKVEQYATFYELVNGLDHDIEFGILVRDFSDVFTLTTMLGPESPAIIDYKVSTSFYAGPDYVFDFRDDALVESLAVFLLINDTVYQYKPNSKDAFLYSGNYVESPIGIPYADDAMVYNYREELGESNVKLYRFVVTDEWLKKQTYSSTNGTIQY